MQILTGFFTYATIVLFSAFAVAPAAAQPSASSANSADASNVARMAKSKKSTKLPCARARWKDDPICFGENDPLALPVPSARALGIGEPSAETRRGDIILRPKSKIFQSSSPAYGSATNANMIGKGMTGGLEAVFRF